MVFLDNASTTRVAPGVVEAMIPWLSARYANPSSIHGPGVEAAEAIDEAARRVASLAGPGPWDVIFTSGGTEGNALAVLGAARGARSRRVVTTALEHPSVLRNATRLEDSGVEVVKVPATAAGAVDPSRVIDAVDERTVLVSIMHGQNEIGTLQPVSEIAAALRSRHGGLAIHVDAVQTAGRLPLAEALASVDMVTFSAHKMHGPKGVGALLVRRSSRRPAPLYLGGDQQHGLRPGTENVAGIVGFGEAARLVPSRPAPLEHLEKAFLAALGSSPACEPGFVSVPRIPGHIALLVRGIPAEPVVHAMEARGFIVSSGSACHSRTPSRSHVLDAVGLPASTDVVRVVASGETSADEMRLAGEAMSSILRGQAPP